MSRHRARLRTWLLAAIALGVASCCDTSFESIETPAAACRRVQTAVQGACGASAAVTCDALFDPECAGSTQIVASGTDDCVMRVDATHSCAEALNVSCTMRCF